MLDFEVDVLVLDVNFVVLGVVGSSEVLLLRRLMVVLLLFTKLLKFFFCFIEKIK